MKKIYTTSEEELRILESKSTFTWEGMSDSEENLKTIEAAVRQNGFNKEEITFYIFKGSLMNTTYELTGDNRYPDDLTFVAIEDYYNALFKLKVGARWLDDIVANNLMREGK